MTWDLYDGPVPAEVTIRAWHTGPLAGRGTAHLARVTGSDRQYGLVRSFLPRRDSARRGRVQCSWDAEAGLYELSTSGGRAMILVYPLRGGGIGAREISAARAARYVAVLDRECRTQAAPASQWNTIARRESREPAPEVAGE